MKTRRLRTDVPHGERIPRHIVEDHKWLQAHHDELMEQYGETYVIVYQGKVLGSGKTYDEALDNAESSLPAEIDDLPIMVEWVGHRFPFGLLRIKQADMNDE